MSQDLLVAIDNGVATITLNRPDRLNAFTAEMTEQLANIVHELEHDEDVRAVLFRGEGRAFSADQVAQGKPAPDLFLLAARELGVDPADCVILEDSPHGVTGALRAGSRAVGFVGGTHLDNRRAEHAALLRATGAAPVLDSMNGMFAALTTSA